MKLEQHFRHAFHGCKALLIGECKRGLPNDMDVHCMCDAGDSVMVRLDVDAALTNENASLL